MNIPAKAPLKMNRKERRAAKKDTSHNVYLQASLQDAMSLHQSGNLSAAKKIYAKLLKHRSDSDIVWNLYGMIFMQEGDLKQAEKCFTEALKITKKNSIYHKNLGVVLHRLDRHEEALSSFKKALAMQPDLDSALSVMGLSYLALYKFDKGRELFEKALQKNPNSWRSKLGLARVDMAYGNLDKAASLMLECIEQDENPQVKIQALLDFLADMHTVNSIDDKYFKMLRDQEQFFDTHHDISKASICAGLAQAYDDMGDNEKAFKYLQKHGDIQKGLHSYVPEHDVIFGARTIHYFTEQNIAELQKGGLDNNNVVFIVGPPRSGTTLIEQVLHAHPKICGMGEDGKLLNLLTETCSLPSVKGDSGTEIPYPFRDDNTKGQEKSLRFCAQKYLKYLEENASDDAEVFVDKSISNTVYLPAILSCFPNAKIIYLKRNPLDACLSAYFKSFKPGAQRYSYDLAHLGNHYRVVYELMDHWQTKFPDNIFEVSYEGFVGDFENQAKALLDFIGVKWSPTCLEYYKADRYVHTASMTQVRKPIYTSSINRWKAYKNFLSPLAEELGPYCPEDFEMIEKT